MSDDLDTDEVLKGFDFLASNEDMEGPSETQSSGERGDWGESLKTRFKSIMMRFN